MATRPQDTAPFHGTAWPSVGWPGASAVGGANPGVHSTPSDRTPYATRARHAVLLALSVAVFAGLIAAAACSRETRHCVLVFFYDGVPPLDSETSAPKEQTQAGAEAGEASARPRAGITYYPIPPYAENRCQGCHDVDKGRLIKTVRQGLCQTCHPDKPPPTKFVHGPMAVDACLACHHHHKSEHPKVLIADAQSLCFRCHEWRELRLAEHHATLQQDRCIDCHDAHGGDDRYFLLPRARAEVSLANASIIEQER